MSNKSEDPKNIVTNTEMYARNLLKTQKILIVMLWDCTMSMNESVYIQNKYINEPINRESGCVKTAVEYYGITLTIVQNYEDAIIELTKQTKPGYCDYYATWVFCGPPFKILPDKQSDPNLVGQFNDVLIQYWKNGGSIVFWAAGHPLDYQANLFLETVTFQDEPDCPSGKTSLHIGGIHQGGQFLKGENSSTLEKPKSFNKSSSLFEQLQRSCLFHNIDQLFEGYSHSFAPYNLDEIKPFKPLIRDSEGGVSSLFYPANLKNGTGDIIIDCCYSRIFQMDSEGVFKYVQNIAGWTARPEIHKAVDNTNPEDWRPEAVIFTIQNGVQWNGFQEIP